MLKTKYDMILEKYIALGKVKVIQGEQYDSFIQELVEARARHKELDIIKQQKSQEELMKVILT